MSIDCAISVNHFRLPYIDYKIYIENGFGNLVNRML